MAAAIRCTLPNCSCECFSPGKVHIRTCDSCKHGWVAHAMDKLSTRHLYPSFQVEVVQFNIVFDIGSLILYGTQAIPIRLKVLLDRLFSVLKHDEVIQVLHGLGWMYEDYARGYVLQAPDGKVLEEWAMATREEESLILQQFLRFGETKSITEVMIQQDKNQGKTPQATSTSNESDIRAFIERMNTIRQLSINRQVRSESPPQPQNVFPGYTNQSPAEIELSPPDQKRPASICSNSTNCSPVSKHSPKSEATVTPPPPPIPMSESPVLNVKISSPDTSPSVSASSSPAIAEDEAPKRYVLSSMERTNHHSSYLSMKLKHLRKSVQPKKRYLVPYTINSSGPKQVTCNLCNKAFYNKGTWKIHYSSVHLKQKYKCTIEGCNMLFSSLRSRNRHSSNPNPKIHSAIPKQRVQISDTAARADNFLSANSSPPVLGAMNERFLNPSVLGVPHHEGGIVSPSLMPPIITSTDALLDLRCPSNQTHHESQLPNDMNGVTVVSPTDSDSNASIHTCSAEKDVKFDHSLHLKKNPRKCLKPTKLSSQTINNHGEDDDRVFADDNEHRLSLGVRKKKKVPTATLR